MPMTASATASQAIEQHQTAKPDALEIFRERAETRAQLCAHGLHSLQESVDTLQAAAVSTGLIKEFGQDEIQRILSESFSRWMR